jgi:hypothetical protein
VILIVLISLGGWFGGKFDLVGFGVCLWELLYRILIYLWDFVGSRSPSYTSWQTRVLANTSVNTIRLEEEDEDEEKVVD